MYAHLLSKCCSQFICPEAMAKGSKGWSMATRSLILFQVYFPFNIPIFASVLDQNKQLEQNRSNVCHSAPPSFYISLNINMENIKGQVFAEMAAGLKYVLVHI